VYHRVRTRHDDETLIRIDGDWFVKVLVLAKTLGTATIRHPRDARRWFVRFSGGINGGLIILDHNLPRYAVKEGWVYPSGVWMYNTAFDEVNFKGELIVSNGRITLFHNR
jgi:hypothetical protein